MNRLILLMAALMIGLATMIIAFLVAYWFFLMWIFKIN